MNISFKTDFLSEEECDKIRNIIEENATPSMVSSKTNLKKKLSDFRTSSSYYFPKDKDPFIQDILVRMNALANLPDDHGEFLAGHLYEVGGEFKMHHDSFGKEGQGMAIKGGDRIRTVLIYLNEDCEGGETEFPKLKLSIAPKKGMAIVWENSVGSGATYQRLMDSLHCGNPVSKGKKFILTRWYRTYPMYVKTFRSKTQLPQLMENGFEKINVPHLDLSDSLNYFFNEDLVTIPKLFQIIKSDILPSAQKWIQEKHPNFGLVLSSYDSGKLTSVNSKDISKTHLSAVIILSKLENASVTFTAQNATSKTSIQLNTGELLFFDRTRCELSASAYNENDLKILVLNMMYRHFKYVGTETEEAPKLIKGNI